MISDKFNRAVRPSGGVELKSTAETCNGSSYILKDDELPPVIKAFLADAVIRLRQDWISLCGKHFLLFESVNKNPGDRLSQHIAATMVNGLLDFGQFLCQFEVFFLENPERLVLLKYGRLSPYECFLKLRDFCRDEMGVADVFKAFQPLGNNTDAG